MAEAAVHSATRRKSLLELGTKLSAATAANDWDAVSAVDRVIARALPQLAALGPMNPAELQAYSRLNAIHTAALARCAQARDAVESQLRDLRNHREGWLAYAVAGEEPLS